MNFFGLGSQSRAIIEPSLRLELLGVRSPDLFGTANRLDRDYNGGALRYMDAVDHFTGRGLQWTREWYHIVFSGLENDKLTVGSRQ